MRRLQSIHTELYALHERRPCRWALPLLRDCQSPMGCTPEDPHLVKHYPTTKLQLHHVLLVQERLQVHLSAAILAT